MTRQTGIRKPNGKWRRAHAIAAKKAIVQRLNEALIERKKTKQALALELQTSRSQLARLLDPENVAVSLETIARAATVLGKRIVFLIEDLDFPLELEPRKSKKPVRSASAQIDRSETGEAAS